MKYQLLIALVLLGIGLGTIILAEEETDPQMPPLPPGAVKLTFSWDYPEEDMSEELFFNLYMSTDVSKPLKEWDLLATIKGTNTQAVVFMLPGKYFFAVSASNFWGESFSEVLPLPSPPREDVKLKVARE